jgi:osmotically-inducible protein OsmY
MARMIRSLGVLGTAALALSGCATMADPFVQLVTDTSMTTAIKARLATEARVGTLTGIGVHTSDDMVRLTGTVADDAERRQVETIARRLAGDNRVINELQVAGGTSGSPRAQKE